jgi:hypothetical protein
MKSQSDLENKIDHDFKKNKKEDINHPRDEDNTPSNLKSNITFIKV